MGPRSFNGSKVYVVNDKISLKTKLMDKVYRLPSGLAFGFGNPESCISSNANWTLWTWTKGKNMTLHIE